MGGKYNWDYYYHYCIFMTFAHMMRARVLTILPPASMYHLIRRMSPTRAASWAYMWLMPTYQSQNKKIKIMRRMRMKNSDMSYGKAAVGRISNLIKQWDQNQWQQHTIMNWSVIINLTQVRVKDEDEERNSITNLLESSSKYFPHIFPVFQNEVWAINATKVVYVKGCGTCAAST